MFTINLDAAKKNFTGFLGGFKGDPYRLYTELESEHVNLSEKLETLDPTERDENGKNVGTVDALERICMAADLQLVGRNAITVEKLAQGAMVLMPELVRRTILAGMQMASRSGYKKLVAVTVPNPGASYHPVYIPEMDTGSTQAKKLDKTSKSMGRRAASGKGGAFPVTSVRYREKDIKVRDYGRQFDVSYKILRNMPWSEFSLFLKLIGVQLAADKLFDVYDQAITGDGTTGAATDVFNGTSGSLTYQDLVHAFLSFDQAFTLNAVLASKTALETILVMPQFQDPNAGFKFQNSGELMTPLGAEMFQVDTTAAGAPTATVIAVMDKRFAVREAIAQPLMVEAKKIIELKFEEAVISEESVFSVIADGALKRIVYT